MVKMEETDITQDYTNKGVDPASLSGLLSSYSPLNDSLRDCFVNILFNNRIYYVCYCIKNIKYLQLCLLNQIANT